MFGFTPSDIQAYFLKHTAQELKHSLELINPDLLDTCLVNKAGRKYQIWKRHPLSVELRTTAVFNQKLEYIHYNPVKAGIRVNAEDYYYSLARFYHDGSNDFGVWKHYSGN